MIERRTFTTSRRREVRRCRPPVRAQPGNPTGFTRPSDPIFTIYR